MIDVKFQVAAIYASFLYSHKPSEALEDHAQDEISAPTFQILT